MIFARRAFFGVLLMAVAACSTAAGRRQAAETERTTVSVDNQALLDMTIYVFSGGQRIRLGTARGLNTTVLTIPPSIVFGATSLRFQADPIGGRSSPASETISVTEGDEVVLRIPPS